MILLKLCELHLTQVEHTAEKLIFATGARLVEREKDQVQFGAKQNNEQLPLEITMCGTRSAKQISRSR